MLEVWDAMQSDGVKRECVATEMESDGMKSDAMQSDAMQSHDMKDRSHNEMEMAESVEGGEVTEDPKQCCEMEMAHAEARQRQTTVATKDEDDAHGDGAAEYDATPKDLCYTLFCQNLFIGIL